MRLCEEVLCTGCGACENSCRIGAIRFISNKNGAKVPFIDSNKCIECGKCAKACPILQQNNKSKTAICYAAWSLDKNIRAGAASSGIVSTIALNIIARGGIVFGTRYKEGKLIFDYACNEKQVYAFQGSKYIQAEIGDSYATAQRYLKQNRQVLFVGTPCQIAGLKGYLGKDYPNLFTIDLVCHGVVPQSYLEDYLQVILKGKRYDKVLFRGKHGNKIAVYQDDKLIYIKDKLADAFYAAYAKGIMHRENCYSCKFSSLERVSDITAGDFWGIDKKILQQDSSDIPFISLMLINTEKGELFIKNIENKFYLQSFSIEMALKSNKQLSIPCEKHMDREAFLENYHKRDVLYALKKTSIYTSVKKMNRAYKLRRIVKPIKKMFSRRRK